MPGNNHVLVAATQQSSNLDGIRSSYPEHFSKTLTDSVTLGSRGTLRHIKTLVS